MSNLTIHIGLHKTGTTYLQQTLFKDLPDVHLVRGFHPSNRLLASDKGKHLILSDEGLSGRLWHRSYLKDFYENIERIKRVYKDPSIILGIRCQKTFILSIYKQYLHEKGDKGFEFLFDIRNDTGLLKHEELLLMPKINYLKNAFDNVFIYSQESLSKRQNDFVMSLMNFIGIEDVEGDVTDEGKPLNVGVKSELQVKFLRRLNKLSKNLEAIHPRLGLYSKFFRKWRLTPRNISQIYLKTIRSKDFSLGPEYDHFINQYYSNDWNEASGSISY